MSYEEQMRALGIDRGQLAQGFVEEPTYYTPVKAEKVKKAPLGRREERPLLEDCTTLRAGSPGEEKLRLRWLAKKGAGR